jgi:hypothetical protein
MQLTAAANALASTSPTLLAAEEAEVLTPAALPGLLRRALGESAALNAEAGVLLARAVLDVSAFRPHLRDAAAELAPLLISKGFASSKPAVADAAEAALTHAASLVEPATLLPLLLAGVKTGKVKRGPTACARVIASTLPRCTRADVSSVAAALIPLAGSSDKPVVAAVGELAAAVRAAGFSGVLEAAIAETTSKRKETLTPAALAVLRSEPSAATSSAAPVAAPLGKDGAAAVATPSATSPSEATPAISEDPDDTLDKAYEDAGGDGADISRAVAALDVEAKFTVTSGGTALKWTEKVAALTALIDLVSAHPKLAGTTHLLCTYACFGLTLCVFMCR